MSLTSFSQRHNIPAIRRVTCGESTLRRPLERFGLCWKQTFSTTGFGKITLITTARQTAPVPLFHILKPSMLTDNLEGIVLRLCCLFKFYKCRNYWKTEVPLLKILNPNTSFSMEEMPEDNDIDSGVFFVFGDSKSEHIPALIVMKRLTLFVELRCCFIMYYPNFDISSLTPLDCTLIRATVQYAECPFFFYSSEYYLVHSL